MQMLSMDFLLVGKTDSNMLDVGIDFY